MRQALDPTLAHPARCKRSTTAAGRHETHLLAQLLQPLLDLVQRDAGSGKRLGRRVQRQAQALEGNGQELTRRVLEGDARLQPRQQQVRPVPDALGVGAAAGVGSASRAGSKRAADHRRGEVAEYRTGSMEDF